MRNPGGYVFVTSDGPSDLKLDRMRCEHIPEGTWESDTFTCFHCDRVIHVKPKMDPADMGGLCKVCMKLICPACIGKGCTPFEKKLDLWEARERALRSYGM